MSLLAAWRGFLLLFAVVISFLRFAWIWLSNALRGRRLTQRQRAEWLHRCCRLAMAALGIRSKLEGTRPVGTTVIVSNHLSYLDILIASAVVPCAFVAKDEIAGWPVFGSLGRLGGTIFLDRESRISAWDAAETMAHRLAEDVSVLFFPEGTSTDGSEVIHFHSTLFAAAIEAGVPVTPAAIFYEPKDPRSAERDLCWYGDDLFLPHLKQVLGVAGFTATVRFGSPELYPDRRTAAWRTHNAVEAMRAEAPTPAATASELPRSASRNPDPPREMTRASPERI